MKKKTEKIKKNKDYEKYGLDVPDKVLDETEKLINEDSIKRQRNVIESLEKEVEELGKLNLLISEKSPILKPLKTNDSKGLITTPPSVG